MKPRPTFSVVTIARDAGGDLHRTVDSVLHQTYPAVEYIVIDGASTDGSLTHLRPLVSAGRLMLVSEADDGIADAMNKGIRLGRADFILHLHAGDTLHATDTLERVAKSQSDIGWLWASGAVDMVDSRRDLVTHDVFPFRDGTRFHRPHGRSPLNHQATFVHRTLFEAAGMFDPSYRISMDYELWLRLLSIAEPYPLDFVVSDMLLGGESATDRVRGALESIRARRERLTEPIPGQRWLDLWTVSNRIVLETVERTLPAGPLASLRHVKRRLRFGS